MAVDRSALLDLLGVMRSADGGDLMRRLLASMLQLLVDAEAAAFIGAEPHERSEAGTNQRNGTRDKLVATATGDITVKMPKVRQGAFFPSLLSAAARRPRRPHRIRRPRSPLAQDPVDEPARAAHKEVKSRTDVVGIFPDAAAPLRLAACVLIEAHDEWQVTDRRYLSEASLAQLTPPEPTAIQPRRDVTGSDTNEVIDTTTIKTA